MTRSFSISSLRPADSRVDVREFSLLSNKKGAIVRTIERLRRSAVGISPERTIHDAASVMDHAGVGALGVVDGDRLIGIVTRPRSGSAGPVQELSARCQGRWSDDLSCGDYRR